MGFFNPILKFQQKSYETEIKSGILPHHQQQKFRKFVDDNVRTLSWRKGRRWILVHGLCFTRNVWMSFVLTFQIIINWANNYTLMLTLAVAILD